MNIIYLLGGDVIGLDSVVPHFPLRARDTEIILSNANQSWCLDFVHVVDWRALEHFLQHFHRALLVFTIFDVLDINSSRAPKC